MATSLTMEDIGKHMSFQVYPSAILGSSFTNVILLSISSYDKVLESSPAIRHNQVYPTLPGSLGVIDDYRKYLYGVFKLPNGKEEVIGMPWIKYDTLNFSTNQTLKVTIRGLSGVVNETRVKNLLLGANITDFDIMVED